MQTVNDLIRALEDIRDEDEANGDLEVRIAYQPSWPLQGHLSRDVAVRRQGGHHKAETKCVYVLESGQVSDAPYAPSGIFKGRLTDDKPECLNCGKPAVVKRARGGHVCEACRMVFEEGEIDDED